MAKNVLEKLKEQSIGLTPVTRYCKICFKEINDHSLYNSFNPKSIICENCFREFKAKFKSFRIGSIKCLSIYDYDETIKKLLYTFKGCYDYELKDVFLSRYLTYLKLLYRGYIVVPVPSNKIDDIKRGFNHVVEIYKSLGLPMVDALIKVKNEKQSSKSKKNRLNIDTVIVGQNLEKLYGKKVLIVDDVYTTGATMHKAISVIKEASPKQIKVLVIAKTIDLKDRK